MSTGSAGAVKATLLEPDSYASLTLFPGAPEGSDHEASGELGDLPVFVYVGEKNDARTEYEAGATAFEDARVPAELRIVDGSGHKLPDKLGLALAERLASLED